MYHQHPIIIVDNDPDDQYLLSYSFQQICSENDILFLNSGEELLNYLSANEHSVQPSLVVIDYNMPVLNGGETLRRIKSNPILAHIPVLVYSTSITHEMRIELQSIGALMCMEKAEDTRKLMEHARFFRELIQAKNMLKAN